MFHPRFSVDRFESMIAARGKVLSWERAKFCPCYDAASRSADEDCANCETQAGMLDPAHWPLSRVVALAIVALLLMLGSFLVFAHFGGAPPGSTYVPAHMDNGKFVPAETR